jgi:hypothetical protein
VIYAYLPKRSADDLARAIATYTAAREVLETKTAVTDEAREAQLATSHRRNSAEARLQGLMQEIVDGAIVLKGGGTQVTGASLKDALLEAGQDAAVRLFPRFADADHPGWGTVVTRAGQGNVAALEAVGFSGDAKTHPVSKAILDFVGAGKKGSEIRSRFASPPYGWGKDAVDGALLTLLAGDVLEARTEGVPVTAKQLTVPKIGVSTFRAQTGRAPAVDERTAFRAVCQLVGVDCKAGEEAAKSSELIHVLIELARSAGGSAPLPEPPSTVNLEEQQPNSESERVIEIAAMTELKGEVDRWKKLSKEATKRMDSWHLVQRLAAHAGGLASAPEIADQLRAIEEQRTLLLEPDPLATVQQSLTSELRDAVAVARNEVATARAAARAELEKAEGWQKLKKTQQEQILQGNDLLEPSGLAIGTDEELLDSLDRMPLEAWAGKVREVPTALAEALLTVARELEPEVRPVQLPRATLKTPDEVATYVSGVKVQLESEIAEGPIVVS